MDTSTDETLSLISLLAETAIIWRRRNDPQKVIDLLAKIEFEASAERHHLSELMTPASDLFSRMALNDADIPW